MAGNTIILNPLANAEGRYVVLKGKTSIKQIEGHGKKQVTPLSVANFMRDVLSEPPASGSEMLMYDNGFSIESKVILPGAMSPVFGDISVYKKGELYVVSVNSGEIVDSHRVLQILDALPAINGNNVNDVRAANDFVQDSNRFLGEAEIGIKGQIKKALHQLPELTSQYTGKIDMEKLHMIANSAPDDSYGNRIMPNGKTDLVVASPSIKENELRYLLEHPEQLNELVGLRLRQEGGIVTGVTLVSPPCIVHATQGIEDGKTAADFATETFYNTTFRENILKAMARTHSLNNATALLLSPAIFGTRQPKMVFGPAGEVDYIQAVQAVVEGGVGVNTNKIPVFAYNGGINLNEQTDYASSIGKVMAFETNADLSSDFRKPADLKSFDGDIAISPKAKSLFGKYFKEGIDAEARKLEQEQHVKVRGVVLGAIEVQQHMVDNFVSIGYDPEGQYRLAATFLLEK